MQPRRSSKPKRRTPTHKWSEIESEIGPGEVKFSITRDGNRDEVMEWGMNFTSRSKYGNWRIYKGATWWGSVSTVMVDDEQFEWMVATYLRANLDNGSLKPAFESLRDKVKTIIQLERDDGSLEEAPTETEAERKQREAPDGWYWDEEEGQYVEELDEEWGDDEEGEEELVE